MSFQAFQGFQDIEEELVAANLIAPPPPPSGPVVLVDGVPASGQTSSQQLTPQQQIYNLFSTTQQGAISYNAHPAVVLAVEWMKAQLLDPHWNGSNLNSTIFKNIPSTPSSYSSVQVDDASLVNGGKALLVKAVYNNCTTWDDDINLDQCNASIATLNSYIWDNKTSLLIMWYRQSFNIWPTENTPYVDMYKAVLCSQAFRNLKEAQASNGTWIDANLEMFNHFVKLAACGATDDQINDIYQELTTVAPILDGSAFREIYTNHWREYEGWLSQGYLDFQDLGATNLDASTQVLSPIPTRFPVWVTDYLAGHIIQDYGYWKSPPPPSCLSASTQVLMASGETKAISKVMHGDSVVSGLLGTTGSSKTRTVAFVSKSERAGRPLYELKALPGIQFTATHPFVTASVSQQYQGVLPKLQFVQHHFAASLNPTWQSFETSAIDRGDLIKHDGSKDQSPEFLYDIIFEPMGSVGESSLSEALPIYIVQASDGTQRNVFSEAPLIEWFPMEMILVGNVIHALLGSHTDPAKLIDTIGMYKASLQSLLRTLAGTNVSQHLINTTTDVTLNSLLLLNKPEDSQRISDLIEKLIMRLGRTIGREIYTGWLNPSQPSVPEKSLVDILVVHVLRRLSKSGGNPEPIVTSWAVNINKGDPSAAHVELDGKRQGHNTVLLHQAILLPSLQQEVKVDSKPMGRFIKVELVDHTGTSTLVGGGTLSYGSQSILSIGNLTTRGVNTHAVLEVELRQVPHRHFMQKDKYGIKEQAEYAACLGYAFGLKLLDLKV